MQHLELVLFVYDAFSAFCASCIESDKANVATSVGASFSLPGLAQIV